MKKCSPIILFLLFGAVFTLSGCSNVKYADGDKIIITPKELSAYIGKGNTVIVDMQAAADYEQAHVSGAVNIEISSIVVSVPVDNMLASKGKIQKVMSAAGIGNDTTVVIYDEGKSMNASRLWWTLLCYGHDNVKVVSGGLPAIQKEGIALTNELPQITPAEFVATDRTGDYNVTMYDVLEQVNTPDANTILLDARRDDEYQEGGKVPGSVMYTHTKNFYVDGMFLDRQATRINYLEAGIRPENQIITYCRTSMRSACTFLSLYDAGYRNIKMYDGAYLEWSASGQNPVEMPEGAGPVQSGRDSS